MIIKSIQINTERYFFSFMIPVTSEKPKKAKFLKIRQLYCLQTQLKFNLRIRLVECDHGNCGMK